MFKRADRLKELFLHEIVALLPEIRDPGMKGFITITGLELSNDKKSVVVFFSVYGTEEDRISTGEALERSRGFIRQKLGKLRLKVIPEIRFRYDQTPERADRVEVLLHKIKSETINKDEKAP